MDPFADLRDLSRAPAPRALWECRLCQKRHPGILNDRAVWRGTNGASAFVISDVVKGMMSA
jgi:hypothetical protein